MQKHSWWQRLHWPEYGSELLGTAFLVFIALSAGAQKLFGWFGGPGPVRLRQGFESYVKCS